MGHWNRQFLWNLEVRTTFRKMCKRKLVKVSFCSLRLNVFGASPHKQNNVKYYIFSTMIYDALEDRRIISMNRKKRSKRKCIKRGKTERKANVQEQDDELDARENSRRQR